MVQPDLVKSQPAEQCICFVYLFFVFVFCVCILVDSQPAEQCWPRGFGLAPTVSAASSFHWKRLKPWKDLRFYFGQICALHWHCAASNFNWERLKDPTLLRMCLRLAMCCIRLRGLQTSKEIQTCSDTCAALYLILSPAKKGFELQLVISS